MTRDVRMIWKK